MNVFTLYTEAELPIIRLWARSWKARGWTPRLLTPDDVAEAGNAVKAMRGKGIFTSCRLINLSYRRRTLPTPKELAVAPGLVLFPESSTEADILARLNSGC